MNSRHILDSQTVHPLTVLKSGPRDVGSEESRFAGTNFPAEMCAFSALQTKTTIVGRRKEAKKRTG